MKKPPHILSLLLLGVLWGVFLVPKVEAVTIYQQFSDGSGEEELNAGCLLLGSFSVSSAIDIVPSEIQFVARNDSAFTNSLFNWVVGTSSVTCNSSQLVSIPARVSPSGSPVWPNDDVIRFGIGTSTTLASSQSSYVPGEIYYVYADSGITDVFITTNLSGNFWYGYLTAGGFTLTFPIHPGIPGYTDVGISTTSQQVYCNQNFSTSTGLLDSLGQSISLGVCNVGVFLFIPSQNALNSFAALSSTTQTKIPFSYYYDVKSILESATSTSGNFTSIHLDLGSATGVGSTSPFAGVLNQDFQLLSTSTISAYISQSTYDLLMLLARYAIWIVVMFHLYRRIVPRHANV